MAKWFRLALRHFQLAKFWRTDLVAKACIGPTGDGQGRCFLFLFGRSVACKQVFIFFGQRSAHASCMGVYTCCVCVCVSPRSVDTSIERCCNHLARKTVFCEVLGVVGGGGADRRVLET